MVSGTFDVYYDLENTSSGSTLDKIINAITGETREYKHAYYAQGCNYDYILDMWMPNDDDEYVIYSHDSFPKAGKYSLKLIPTGSTMHVTNSSGFERDINTYTIFSEDDEEEYYMIRQMKSEYDILRDAVNGYKENIEAICNSFLG